MSVNASRGLDPGDVALLATYSSSAGAKSTVVHQGTVDLTLVERRGRVITAAPDGAGYPMSTLAVDPTMISATTNKHVAATLDQGLVVVGATAALVDDLQVGDKITVTGWSNLSGTFEIGTIAPDGIVSGTELMMSINQARSVGLDRPFSVRTWAFTSRTAAVFLIPDPMHFEYVGPGRRS